MSWDYIAGFIDGEGSIIRRNQTFNVLISQTNFEVLDQIRKFVGCGHVYPVAKRKLHWKDAWVYSAGDSKGVYRVLSSVADRLVVKKTLAAQALEEIRKRFVGIEDEKKLRANRFREGKALRKQGLTYRAIGKKLNADFGYMRRLLLKEM